jgi:hypothetical protein
MPARTEPPMARRSRSGSLCARWLRLSALLLGASSLTVSCFLNPKTDDLPGSQFAGPPIVSGEGDMGGLPSPGGDDGDGLIDDGSNNPGNAGAPGTDDPEVPGPPTGAAPDAGAEPADTLAGDAGGELSDTALSADAGIDAQ